MGTAPRALAASLHALSLLSSTVWETVGMSPFRLLLLPLLLDEFCEVARCRPFAVEM